MTDVAALGVTADEYAEVYALLAIDDPAVADAVVAAIPDRSGRAYVARAGRKRRKCKRTPAHPHCKSVKWARVYEALRRKGKSKKNAAQIANHMHNKWRAGLVTRKTWP